jgi:hypothetical protein
VEWKRNRATPVASAPAAAVAVGAAGAELEQLIQQAEVEASRRNALARALAGSAMSRA